MATSQDLRINYLLEAVDNASNTMKKVDETLGKLNSSYANQEAQISAINKVQVEADKYNNKIAGSYKKTNDELVKVNKSTQELSKSVTEGDKNYQSFFQTISKLLDQGAISSTLKSWAIDIGIVGAAFLGLSASEKVVGAISTAIVKLDYQTVKWAINLDVLLNNYPKLATIAVGAVNVIRSSALALEQTFIKTHAALKVATETSENLAKTVISSFGTVKNVAVGAVGATQSIGKSLGEAALKTEYFDKGILALATRTGAFGGILGALGYSLFQSDSIMTKMAGGTLLALAAALVGVSGLIGQLITLMGGLIYNIGTALVNSTSKAIDKFEKFNQASFAFKFIVQSLNRETNNATGSFEEWQDIVKSFTETYGFATSEIQNSISEMLRLGNSLGLNKKQMKDLLPIIADLAVANHKDLFTSTLAVAEAIGGQSIMLQNMGINLADYALLESKAVKQIKGKVTALGQHEKAQLRYNVLLEKAATVNGLATESLNTISGAIRKSDALWENINAKMGEGAQIIENRVYGASYTLLKIFEQFSPVLLEVTGFFSALTGRMLQGIGIATQYAFTIVLITSSVAALNILLKNQAIAKWILQLAQADIITKTLASSNLYLAQTIQLALTNIGTYGLTITSVGSLVLNTFRQIALAAWAALAPILVVAAQVIAVVGLIAGALYLLYQAFKRIEEQTGLVTRAWNNLVRWWNEYGIIDDIKAAMKSFGAFMERSLVNAIFFVAEGFIYLWKTVLDGIDIFIKARAAYYSFVNFILNILQPIIASTVSYFRTLYSVIVGSRAFEIATDFVERLSRGFEFLTDKIAEFSGKSQQYFDRFAASVYSLIEKLPSKFNELIGISNVYAESYVEISNGIETVKKATQSLSEEDKKASEAINKKIESADNLISKLEQQRLKELEMLKTSNKVADEQETHHKKNIANINYEIEAINKLKKTMTQLVLGEFAVGSIQTALSTTTQGIQDLVKELKDPKKSDEERAKLVKQLKELYSKLPALSVMSDISGAVGLVGAFSKGAAGAIKAAATAIGTAIAGPLGPMIGDLVGQIVDVFGADPAKFQQMIVDTFREIPVIIANIITNIASLLGGPILKEAIMTFIDNIPKIAEAMGYAVATIFGSPTFWVTVAFAVAKAFIKSIPVIIKAWISGFAKGIGEMFGPLKKVFNFLKDNFKYIAIAFAIPLLPIIAAFFAIKYIIENFSSIVEKLNQVLTFFISIFTNIPAMIGELFSKAFEIILKIPQLLLDFYTNVLPNLVISAFSKGFEIVQKIFGSILNIYTNVIPNLLMTGFQKALDIFKQLPAIFTNAVNGFGKSIANAGENFVKAIVKGASKFVTELINGITGIFGGGSGGLGGLISGIPIIGGPASSIIGGIAHSNPVTGGIASSLGFAQGGVPFLRMLRAQSGMLVGGNHTSGDKIPVRVNSREMILTTGMQEKLFKMLASGDYGNERPIEITTNVQIDERTLGKAFTKLQSNGWVR